MTRYRQKHRIEVANRLLIGVTLYDNEGSPWRHNGNQYQVYHTKQWHNHGEKFIPRPSCYPFSDRAPLPKSGEDVELALTRLLDTHAKMIEAQNSYAQTHSAIDRRKAERSQAEFEEHKEEFLENRWAPWRVYG